MASSSNSETRNHTSIDTTEIARRVLLTMSRHEIPVTPENYRVWFEYMIGSNQELIREIDGYIEDGTTLDDERNRQIFEKYYGEAKNRKLIEEYEEILKIL